MKRKLSRLLAFIICVASFLSVLTGCEKEAPHTEHVFDQQVTTQEYLKSSATCAEKAKYYYSCTCGEKDTSSFFSYGEKGEHNFSKTSVFQEATCVEPDHYYKKCSVCGATDTVEYVGETLLEHKYTKMNPDYKYLKEEATATSSAVYYYSCTMCGGKGTQTFNYGKTLTEYQEEITDKTLYKPISVTVSLYDAQNSVYGFTFNTKKEPLRPVLQIQEGNSLTDECLEYGVSFSAETSYDDTGDAHTSNTKLDYCISKAEVELKPNTTYTYRLYDKYADVGTNSATITTKDASAEIFKFAHVSDSQTANKGNETYFGQVLNRIISDNNDFIVHTGDVVEWSKYEAYWDRMLDNNFAYLSQIPVQAISGNHETIYQYGSKETFKHFNYKLPAQASVDKGLFYSFVYGDVKFIMLNTNDLSGNKFKDEQYNWLISELENNDCTWTVVALHNPLYSVGTYGSNPDRNQIALALRQQLQGIFAKYGVDIVLQGHDHCISRTYPIDGNGIAQAESMQTENGIEYSLNPQGTIYVMDGPATDQTRSPFASDNTLYKYAQASQNRSWAEFTVSGNTLTVKVQHLKSDLTADTYQTWGIRKTS